MRLRRAGLLSWVVGAGISVVVAGLALRIALSEPTKTAPTPAGVASAKTLRLSFPRAETSFDPAGVSDIYSGAVTAHIFESLYQYDYLARPYAVQPCTAAGMPEVSEDRRTYNVRIKPGIYFVDDPAFGGKRRELVAEDYVFSIKRLVDPKLRSPSVDDVLALGLIGLGELRKQALSGQAFDYDTPIVGLRALDRYTLQFQMTHPHAQLMFLLATKDNFGAVAREAVQHYGEDLGSHPVGTGPFVLAQWVRGSSVVLERNPSYRVTTYSASEGAQPLPAAEQAIADQLTGRSLPLIDRVEISIIEEHQPRWLSFLNRSQDILDDVPVQYASLAFAGSHVVQCCVLFGT